MKRKGTKGKQGQRHKQTDKQTDGQTNKQTASQPGREQVWNLASGITIHIASPILSKPLVSSQLIAPILKLQRSVISAKSWFVVLLRRWCVDNSWSKWKQQERERERTKKSACKWNEAFYLGTSIEWGCHDTIGIQWISFLNIWHGSVETIDSELRSPRLP